jgi:hypothetical protein
MKFYTTPNVYCSEVLISLPLHQIIKILDDACEDIVKSCKEYFTIKWNKEFMDNEEHAFESKINIKAQLVYEFISAFYNAPGMELFLYTDNRRQNYCNALVEYKKVKDYIIAKEQNRHGIHWGSATEYNKWDPTDKNELLLKGE